MRKGAIWVAGGLLALVLAVVAACQTSGPRTHFAVVKSDAEWRKILTPDQYDVLRKAGTEQAFSGKYDHFYQKGTYYCAACGNPLFSSDTKFNSGTGWPSFWKPLAHGIVTRNDASDGMSRTEVLCARCGGHLGHVFDDGPPPTGLRYCMNSVALRFTPRASSSKSRQ